MDTFKTKFVKSIVAPLATSLLLLGSIIPASAAGYNATFDFGVLLTGSGGGASTAGQASSATFATMSVQSADYKTFTFDLQLNNLTSVFGAGAFVSSLQVNTFNVDPLSSTIASGAWGVNTVMYSSQASNTGSVSWDFTDSFCAQNNNSCPSNNTPGARLTGSEQVKWNTVFSSAQNPPFDNPPFMLHVQGYGNDSSKWVAVTPIPEPEIYAMLAAGLGLMGFVARRRKQAAA